MRWGSSALLADLSLRKTRWRRSTFSVSVQSGANQRRRKRSTVTRILCRVVDLDRVSREAVYLSDRREINSMRSVSEKGEGKQSRT
jgi:hypothetical protein